MLARTKKEGGNSFTRCVPDVMGVEVEEMARK